MGNSFRSALGSFCAGLSCAGVLFFLISGADPSADAAAQMGDVSLLARCRDVRCTLDQRFVDTLAVNALPVRKQARLIPFLDDGVPRGVFVYGLRAGSLPGLVGLKNGDLFTAVDDAPVVDVADVEAAFEHLRSAGTSRFAIERDGQATILRVDIE
ncbi:hypothetical protein [Nannocystis bainbridge]|uniref:PDZ domain-containing protein n=1 Tax=Nannocystis bainbridge TaxID=2995303 RepID=A0ABT5DSC9_9BACT|nr:hypothetical protein [Nannocystis bainbridge]MDC0716528.1 hypothetical protein [Nannocystis bainbridge]